MKTIIYLLSILTTLVSCNSSQTFVGSKENDDLYFNSKDRQIAIAERKKIDEEEKIKRLAAEKERKEAAQNNDVDYNYSYSSNNRPTNQGNNGDTYITNNNYYDGNWNYTMGRNRYSWYQPTFGGISTVYGPMPMGNNTFFSIGYASGWGWNNYYGYSPGYNPWNNYWNYPTGAWAYDPYWGGYYGPSYNPYYSSWNYYGYNNYWNNQNYYSNSNANNITLKSTNQTHYGPRQTVNYTPKYQVNQRTTINNQKSSNYNYNYSDPAKNYNRPTINNGQNNNNNGRNNNYNQPNNNNSNNYNRPQINNDTYNRDNNKSSGTNNNNNRGSNNTTTRPRLR